MLYTLRRKQFIKAELQTVWQFMCAPGNLAKITPAHMGFDILSDAEDIREMYPGQIIEYYIRPLPGFKTYWVTEITHVSNQTFFVDEQRFGPYKFWHHKHFLKAVAGGVEMTDIVHYALPFGLLGRIVHAIFVRRKLRQIFDYRQEAIEKLFNHP